MTYYMTKGDAIIDEDTSIHGVVQMAEVATGKTWEQLQSEGYKVVDENLKVAA